MCGTKNVKDEKLQYSRLGFQKEIHACRQEVNRRTIYNRSDITMFTNKCANLKWIWTRWIDVDLTVVFPDKRQNGTR